MLKAFWGEWNKMPSQKLAPRSLGELYLLIDRFAETRPVSSYRGGASGHHAWIIVSENGFDFSVYYGDATRLDLLRKAGAASAKVLVIAIDDVDKSLKVADLAREHFPQLTVVARARNVTHWYALRDRL